MTLKFKAAIIFCVGLLVAATVTSQFEDQSGSGAVIYQYQFPVDTLRDGESATFTVPTLLYSKWDYSWTVTATQDSGTTDLTLKLYESAYQQGDTSANGTTTWVELSDTLAVAGSATKRLNGTPVYGIRQKAVVTATGAQKTGYNVKVVLKKY
jgi:hypothetical protein